MGFSCALLVHRSYLQGSVAFAQISRRDVPGECPGREKGSVLRAQPLHLALDRALTTFAVGTEREGEASWREPWHRRCRPGRDDRANHVRAERARERSVRGFGVECDHRCHRRDDQ
jgi:hypothetical protein